MFKINELLKATQGRLISGLRDTAVKGVSIDSRTIKSDEAFIAIKGDNFNGHDFIDAAIKKGAKAVIFQSPYSPLVASLEKITFIEVKDTIKALGGIAGFWREKFDIPVIAVTGSNGKTTAKDMIAWVLSEEFKVLKNIGTKNNHIGLPLTLLRLNSSYDCAALELGTNHFGEIEYLARLAQPNIAVITNIAPAHLEYFKNLKGVFREKTSLLKHLKEPRIAILNADDSSLNPHTNCNIALGKYAIGAGVKRQHRDRINKTEIIFSFGIKSRSDFLASDIKILKRKIEFVVNPHTNCNIALTKYAIGVWGNQKYRVRLKTLGYFNIYNALVAIAIGRIFGMEYKDITGRLTDFKFPQHRLQSLELNNIKFINDTYNSNPASLKQALDVLDNIRIKGRKIFIMGDMLELGNLGILLHVKAGEEAARVCDCLLTVGKLSKFAARAAIQSGLDAKNIFTCASNARARDILFTKISVNPDDIVLVKGSRAMKMEEIFSETIPHL